MLYAICTMMMENDRFNPDLPRSLIMIKIGTDSSYGQLPRAGEDTQSFIQSLAQILARARGDDENKPIGLIALDIEADMDPEMLPDFDFAEIFNWIAANFAYIGTVELKKIRDPRLLANLQVINNLCIGNKKIKNLKLQFTDVALQFSDEIVQQVPLLKVDTLIYQPIGDPGIHNPFSATRVNSEIFDAETQTAKYSARDYEYINQFLQRAPSLLLELTPMYEWNDAIYKLLKNVNIIRVKLALKEGVDYDLPAINRFLNLRRQAKDHIINSFTAAMDGFARTCAYVWHMRGVCASIMNNETLVENIINDQFNADLGLIGICNSNPAAILESLQSEPDKMVSICNARRMAAASKPMLARNDFLFLLKAKYATYKGLVAMRHSLQFVDESAPVDTKHTSIVVRKI